MNETDAAGSYEERLARGEEVDLRPVHGQRVDARDGAGWDMARKVEADVLARLLTVPVGAESGTHRTLWLAGAHIKGTLDLAAAHLTRPLHLEDCYFADETPLLLDNARAITVELPGCHVRGLQASAMHTQGDLWLNHGFTATGEVRLRGAHIHGTLDCDGVRLSHEGATALDASRLVVDGSLWIGSAELTGEVKLINAYVGGQANFSGSTFDNRLAPRPDDRIAVNCFGLLVKGTMLCRAKDDRPFRTFGEFRLRGAHIGGELDLAGGSVTNEGRRALDAYNMVVASTMLCSKGFTATGEMRLRGAQIGGELDCSGSTFKNAGRDLKAIDGERLVVKGTMYCCQEFTAEGEVDLVGARIGELHFEKASFVNGAACDSALNLMDATVARRVLFQPRALTGTVDLRSAKAGSWYDSSGTWFETEGPRAGQWRGCVRIMLNGFTYTAIEAKRMNVGARLRWIGQDAEGYVPQPYKQLAGFYQREGQEQEARRIRIDAQWRRRDHPQSGANRTPRVLRTAWAWLLWVTVGFGYRPWRILVPIGLFYSSGLWLFHHIGRTGFRTTPKSLDPDIHFNSAVYTADLLIPGANLGVRSRFVAVGTTELWATAYTLAGWALAAMLIAGLTGVFKRL
ncbi:hypothetical protein ACQB60_29765 [Actinomycetota bacterium Odt1-20B]